MALLDRFLWLSLNTGLVLWPPALYLGAWRLSYVRGRAVAGAPAGALSPVRFWELALGAVPSLALTLWGTVFYGADGRGTPDQRPWTSVAVTVIAVTSVFFLVFQLLRIRGRPGAPLGAASVGLGAVLTFVGWFVALMAVINDWV